MRYFNKWVFVNVCNFFFIFLDVDLQFILDIVKKMNLFGLWYYFCEYLVMN